MTTILRRRTAAAAAGAVALAATLTVATAGAAQAAAPFTGKLNGLNGTATVSKAGLTIALCTVDCLRTGVKVTTATTAANGSFTAGEVATGTYRVAVDLTVSGKVALPGFEKTAGRGYLHLEPNGRWSLATKWAGATPVAVSSTSQTFTLANAIHNPKDQFTQTTVGSGSYRPCAGRVTTVSVSGFSDLPAGAALSYQWAAGRTAATRTAIPGATSRSYRPTAALTGLYLFMEMTASAPNRTSYDRLANLEKVGNPLDCRTARATIPKRYVRSYGVKRGSVTTTKRVSVVGAKVQAAARKKYHFTIGYTWKVNGSTVGTSRTFRIPRSARGKKLTVTVSVKAAGFKPRSKVIRLGRVR